ncbi:hypothetical protein EON65_02795 [archaeon]|nr:MAG: hypothetical protein EON65_02795 [archaeon]
MEFIYCRLNGENAVLSQSVFTGSYYWCSKQLVNILLDSYVSNPSQTAVAQVIAASSLISDLLPHVLEDACTLFTLPSTFQSTLEELNLSFTFIRWRDTTQEDIVVNLPRVIELTKDISSMVGGCAISFVFLCLIFTRVIFW